MAASMILIAGRSSKQGTSLNKGKLEPEYLEITSTVEMSPSDMARLGLADGDRVRLRNTAGEATLRCKAVKPGELPDGMIFVAYGPLTSQLMDSDTAASGMPISKNIEVTVEPVT